MTEPTMQDRAIVYNRHDHAYDLFLNDELVGTADSYTQGEAELDRLVYDRTQRATPAMRIAELAQAYQRAKSEGRADDARAIREQAFRLAAETHGIAYSTFEAEHAAYRAETKAAA